MAIITTPARLNFGSFLPRQAQTFNTNANINLTTSSGGIAFPFIAERTMTVRDIGVCATGLSATINTALDIGIQTDNGSGLPSGTFITNGSITLPANTWNTAAQFSASSGNPLINTTQAHYLKVGDSIRFANTTGGVATGTDYYIASTPTASQMTVSTSSTLSPVFSFTASVSPGTNTINYNTALGAWLHCDLTPGASITQGTRYWICYQWTGTGTGSMFFVSGDTGTANGQNVMYGLGYATRSAGTWSKVSTTRGIPVAYSDGTNWYGTPQISGGRVVSTTLNNNDRFGFRFSVPAGHPDILLDRIAFASHPTASPGSASNWKAQLFTDAGAGNPTFIADLSVISGTSLGDSGASNFRSTVFQTDSTVWLTADTSYIIMCGFDTTPASGIPTVNYFSGQLQQGTGTQRSSVVGPYNGGFILNWQGAGTWFALNPEAYAPWSITSGGLRYNDSAGGAGGFANATMGFAGIGGN